MYRKGICSALLFLMTFSCHAGWKRKVRSAFNWLFRQHQPVPVYQDTSPYNTDHTMTDDTESGFYEDSGTDVHGVAEEDSSADSEDYIKVRGVSADGKWVVMRISSSKSNLGDCD